MKEKALADERICLLRMKASEMAPFLHKMPPLLHEKAAFLSHAYSKRFGIAPSKSRKLKSSPQNGKT